MAQQTVLIVVIAALCGIALGAGVVRVAAALGHRRHRHDSWRRVVIVAPPAAGQPLTWWADLAGVLSGPALTLHARPHVAFEVVVERHGVGQVSLRVPAALAAFVAQAVERVLPGAAVHVQPDAAALDPAHAVTGYRLTLSDPECFPVATLATTASDPLAEALRAARPHRRGDVLLYQVCVRRAGQRRSRRVGVAFRALGTGHPPTAGGRLVAWLLRAAPDRPGRHLEAEAARAKAAAAPHWLVTVHLFSTSAKAHTRAERRRLRRWTRGGARTAALVFTTGTQRVVARRLGRSTAARLVAQPPRPAELVGHDELQTLAHVPLLPTDPHAPTRPVPPGSGVPGTEGAQRPPWLVGPDEQP